MLAQRRPRIWRDRPDIWPRILAGIWCRDRRGVVALEFAITGLAFFGLLLFVISLAFRLYVQVALDYASSRAARLLAVDSTQTRSASVQHFQAVSFCPLLSPFLACSNVVLSLQPVSDYSNTSAIGTGPPPFTPGQGGSLMLLRAQYTLPALTWPLPGGGSGSFTGAFVNAGYPYQNEY